jgi:ATP-dependent RNA helicase RhlE
MTHEATFAGLGLAEPLLRAIADAGYTAPTPVQAQAIPMVLDGRDLLAAAQTGTGKTAGFTLPILQRLTTGPRTQTRAGRPRCLILTPTRELAAQVEQSVKTYGRHVPIRSVVVFGGVGFQPQVDALNRRVEILVATPGRLLDHAGQKTLDLSGVEILVLDEADRMLDMGFIHDIRRVLALLPKQRQNLLFSATFSDDIRALAGGFLANPERIEVARRNAPAELVAQSVHLVERDLKRDLLAHLIRANSWSQVLVFTRTKHGANRLAEKLDRDGIPAAAIHGNKSQGARTRALADFKSGKVPVLVATDIAARGLDIEELPHVVNFELPNVPEDYVHRIGRTGRAGSTGAAVSLVDAEEIGLLKSIEKLIRHPIERVPVEGFAAPARKFDERAHRQDERHARNGERRHRGKPRSAGANRNEGGRRERSPNAGNGRPQHHRDTAPQRPQAPAEPARPSTHLSEAARHQAQPQPALFAPAGRPRGR